MTSREEIVLALKYFFDVETEASAHEIIGQESDPVDTIAAALDEYRKVDSCEGWIKCSERMPDDGFYVLVSDGHWTWVETHFVEECHINNCKMWLSANPEADPRPLNTFTHWQPLPEPPQESNDDKS